MSSVVGILDILTQKMGYLSQKQGVLAENIANVDTPGYKQREVQAFSFGDVLKQADMGMAVTDPRHIVPASMSGINAKTVESKDTDVSPSGNSVDVENQMMEISKTSVDYQEMTSIYHKMTGLLKIAIKGNSS